MLAQMGQMMQIRQAQQGYESENAVKDFYAQGGDLSTAEGRRNLLSRTGSAGSKLIGQQSEINARDIKTQADSLKMLKENVSIVNTPSDMAIYLQNAAKTPGGQMLFSVVPLDKALASIPNNPAALEAYKRNFGLTADKLFTSAADQLQAQVTREGHGVTMYGHNITKQKNEYEQQFPVMNQVITDQGIGVTPSRGPSAGRITPVYEPGRSPPLPSIVGANANGAPADAGSSIMATQGSPNTLATAVGAPTVNSTPVNSMLTQPPRAQPKPVVRQPVAVMKNGKAVMVSPEEAVGLPPASADAEKAARLQAIKVQDLSRTIKNLEDVTREGGLISQSTGSGIGRIMDASAAFVGQTNPGAIATAKLAPIADMVLKMVPRFEGPQSDKDTQSYKEAAGQLANSALPTETRQAAGKEILRLMKEYKDQFVSSDMAREGFAAGSNSGAAAIAPIYATNGKDRIMSVDGGNTWNPVGAK
jgi:hypothetical protein